VINAKWIGIIPYYIGPVAGANTPFYTSFSARNIKKPLTVLYPYAIVRVTLILYSILPKKFIMLKQLKAHHRNIVQMSFNGFSAKEISDQLGVATVTVSNVLRSPLGKAYMNGLTDKMKDATIDVRKELVGMNKEALNTIRRLMDPKTKAPAAVQLSSAKDVLDRSGYKAPDKLDINLGMHVKTDQEIDAEIAALEVSIKKTQVTSTECDSPKIEEESFDAINMQSMPDTEIEEILSDTSFDPFNNIEATE